MAFAVVTSPPPTTLYQVLDMGQVVIT